jgi:N-acetylmuramoyl-L-alanine amidase
MKNRYTIVAFCLIVFLFAALEVKTHWDTAQETFSNATIKYGSKGSDVRELQGRLKFIGFYYGDIDGDFGYKTLTAVKRFQGEFGMRPVDGIAGPKTKLRIWEATKNWRPTANAARNTGGQGGQTGGKAANKPPASNHMGLSANDLKLMANAVYGEARGESYEGQVAVAAVILNRVNSQSFPNTISGVIFEPRAFTAVADGQIWLEPNERARKAVQDAVNGMDPSDGCIYYFNPDTATSAWIWSRPQYKRIGKHIFCR